MSEENSNIPNRDFQFISGKNFNFEPGYLDTTNDSLISKEDNPTLALIYGQADPELQYYQRLQGNEFNSIKEDNYFFETENFFVVCSIGDNKKGATAYTKDFLTSRVISNLSNEEVYRSFMAKEGLLFLYIYEGGAKFYSYDKDTTDIDAFCNSFSVIGQNNNYLTNIIGDVTRCSYIYKTSSFNDEYFVLVQEWNIEKINHIKISDLVADPLNATWIETELRNTDVYNHLPEIIDGTSKDRYNFLLSNNKMFFARTTNSKMVWYDILTQETIVYTAPEPVYERININKNYFGDDYNVILNVRNTNDVFVFNEEGELIKSMNTPNYIHFYSKISEGTSIKFLKESKSNRTKAQYTFSNYQYDEGEIKELPLFSEYPSYSIGHSVIDPCNMSQCILRTKINQNMLCLINSDVNGLEYLDWTATLNFFQFHGYEDMILIRGNGYIDEQKKWWMKLPDYNHDGDIKP